MMHSLSDGPHLLLARVEEGSVSEVLQHSDLGNGRQSTSPADSMHLDILTSTMTLV